MLQYPANLHYSTDHEWLTAACGKARAGITAYAAQSLGDIVFLQLPDPGQLVTAGEPCGEIESTKSVSELYAPASGTICAVNETAVSNPSVINNDPYGEGWLFEILISETPGTLSASEYRSMIGDAA